MEKTLYFSISSLFSGKPTSLHHTKSAERPRIYCLPQKGHHPQVLFLLFLPFNPHRGLRHHVQHQAVHGLQDPIVAAVRFLAAAEELREDDGLKAGQIALRW